MYVTADSARLLLNFDDSGYDSENDSSSDCNPEVCNMKVLEVNARRFSTIRGTFLAVAAGGDQLVANLRCCRVVTLTTADICVAFFLCKF